MDQEEDQENRRRIRSLQKRLSLANGRQQVIDDDEMSALEQQLEE